MNSKLSDLLINFLVSAILPSTEKKLKGIREEDDIPQFCYMQSLCFVVWSTSFKRVTRMHTMMKIEKSSMNSY